jgi:tetratricopeptide (TPR) repeat protein
MNVVMRVLFTFFISFCFLIPVYSQYHSVEFKKMRPAKHDLSSYPLVSIGEITNAMGEKSRTIYDLNDDLTQNLLSLKTKKYLLDPEKANSSDDGLLMISGRIQSERINQELMTRRGAVAVNGCSELRYWDAKGEIVFNLKLIDGKNSSLIKQVQIVKSISKESREARCSTPEKVDLEEIQRDLIREVTLEITRYLENYYEFITLTFKSELFGNSFKELNMVVSFIQMGNWEAALNILKDYTEDTKFKDKTKAKAYYNYGMLLLYLAQYDLASQAFTTGMKLDPKDNDFRTGFELITIEKEYQEKAKL